MKKSAVLISALLLFAASLTAVAGDDNKVQTLGYLGFRDQAATLENFQKLADAGLSLFTLEMDQSTLQEQFDLAQQVGIKIMAVLAPYTDRKTLEEVDFETVEAIVLKYKDHPALYGWHICDEPGVKRIPMLKAVKERIEAIDPEHPVYINLCPLGSIRALGTDYYRDYVESFARDCKLSILSYDCYPVFPDSIIDYWYMCNESAAGVARKYGIPFWGFAASTWIDREGPHNIHAQPTVENLRLQIYTNLAYGAQCIQYFTIRDYGGTSLAPFMHNTEWTEAYDFLKEANLEMLRRSFVFDGCKVVATRFTHKTPYSCLPLIPKDLPGEIGSIDTDRTALVSFIENGDSRYVVVVNSSCTDKMNVTARFSSSVDIIDRAGTVSSCPAGAATFSVDEGDMLVIRL